MQTPSNIDRLRVAVEEWLIRNGLDCDTKFYAMPEWLARGEEYLNDAELVLVFEGSLHTMLNYGGDTSEFDDYIESFGYFYGLGHSWNMGFYPLPDYDFTSSSGTYTQKLRDPRWKRKAELVKKRAGYKCQDCGASSHLEAHHCYYTGMRECNEPWEYPLSALRCLCRTCHERRPKEESRMRAYMAGLTTEQLARLRDGLDSAFYWFQPEAVLDFLQHLSRDDGRVGARFAELLSKRNEDA